MDKATAPETTKTALLAACKGYVNQRIANAQQAIASANDAAQDDTKSSAGDKFETTREMMQQELKRHHQLLADAKRMEHVLVNIDMRMDQGPVRLGSLVTTNRGIFFIAISMGQLQIGNVSYWVISAVSPLGQRLMGMQAGEQVVFNGTEYQVLSFC
ncbi:3-oxoacyl-ACP synthase [Parapedobacter sp. 10938]|uniref:3-oxoacyl-ACP synthase n=1 Tax=Parapedobacter flavus TaxID=3110225 RepID=UPI002DB83F3F|nr:3-oxoacyl-ACP synthase [Parapedobacter sp. 10938]MEC3881645.1 3-oxoacyl-ACP synthase [Parapedobacter sp. 10938]